MSPHPPCAEQNCLIQFHPDQRHPGRVFFVVYGHWSSEYTRYMASTFFFYDLETSGLNPRDDRIMQFAGQRTDLDMNPVGEPINIMVSLTDDILPSPEAIAVTGITPQQTLTDGMKEHEFCKFVSQEVFTAGTIVVGYNSVRFDDEFMRHTLWRNFYDPYEWCWLEGRGRWDMLDVIRMTRALRPEGIEWPVDDTGKAVNKLELLAKVNNLVHTRAHDALSDVEALIALTRLIKQKQPKLFSYMFSMRTKQAVAKLVNLNNPQPFVYASGRYDATYEKTTVAYPIAEGVKPGSILVYDLRVDPSPFLKATPKQLASILFADRDIRSQEGFMPLPVKELSFNRCPAVAPLGVLDETTSKRLTIDMDTVRSNHNKLISSKAFATAVHEAYAMREPYAESSDVEQKLYDGFAADGDKVRMSAVRSAGASELVDFVPDFTDTRLSELLLRYKAREFPTSLSDDEYQQWEQYRAQKLQARLPGYLASLQKLQAQGVDGYLLEELQLWAESIVPADLV